MADNARPEAIDPTKNVLDALHTEARHRDDLRAADLRYNDAMREWGQKHQDALRAAEQRRIDGLAELRVQYDVIIEEIRRTQLDSTSTLLATQLREVKLDLSDRTSKLEQFRWESGGTTTGRDAVWGRILGAAGFGAALAAIVSFLVFKH
jgi:hypothetical protein